MVTVLLVCVISGNFDLALSQKFKGDCGKFKRGLVSIWEKLNGKEMGFCRST